jgi:hypothetical protein
MAWLEPSVWFTFLIGSVIAGCLISYETFYPGKRVFLSSSCDFQSLTWNYGPLLLVKSMPETRSQTLIKLGSTSIVIVVKPHDTVISDGHPLGASGRCFDDLPPVFLRSRLWACPSHHLGHSGRGPGSVAVPQRVSQPALSVCPRDP